MKQLVACLALTVALFGGQLAAAQEGSLDERLKAVSSVGKTDAEYHLGAGDLVEIRVFGVDNFNQTVRLSASGQLKLPLLDAVDAAGLTPAELEQRLTILLQDGVIKDPQVSVFVKEYRSQSVYVLGAVRNPGQYQIALQLKVVDVISMAGGMLPTAGDEAVVQRPVPGGGEQTIRINMRELLEKGDLALNIIVRGGDVVHVQERPAETVYVVGEVNRIGAFAMPPKQPIRITQVFAWAGGATKTAKLNAGVLLRYKASGEREELPIKFSDILKGKQEDFFVQANDIIFVPGSKVKSFGYNMLSGMPGALATLPYRIP